MGGGKDQFASLMSFMPEGWEGKAKELGAFQRVRQVKTAEDLMKLILLYLTEGKSYAGTGALVRMSGAIRLNKTAVYKRICGSGAWLKWLCEHVCRQSGLLGSRRGWQGSRHAWWTPAKT